MTHVVVVLNWFGRKDTLACVESLRAGCPEAAALVVDNGSHDGTLEEVAATFPGTDLLQTGANLGFTGGMNAGLRWALDGGATTVTILNNDTIVPPGAMARLAEVARSGVAVSPVAVYAADPTRVWFAAGTIDPDTGLPHHGASVPMPDPGPDGLRETDILAGACVTASAETWRRVGLLDERYFLLFEDSDWSRRALAQGIPLRVDTRTTIRHRVSASFGGAMSYLGLFYYTRNGLLFIRGQAGGPTTRMRFLRRHVIPQVRPQQGEASRRDLVYRCLIVAAALAADVTRQYGPAPRALHRLATQWASSARTVS